MADEQQQIEGLPEGATLRPVQPAQTAASDSSQVEGLPEGATLRPIAPPAAPTVTKTPTAPHVHAAPTTPVVKGAVAPPSPKQDIVTQIDTTGGLPLDQTLALKAVRGARGLYHGAMGENESETAKGKTSTASPAAENLGFTPENIGYNIGSVGHGIYEFGKEAVKDIFGNTPIVVPNEKGTSIGDPTAHTLMAKYITAPSLAEREESEKEMEKYFKSQGPEAAGHAISAFLHGTLGEYVPAIGPLAMSIEKQAQEGDIGGALAGVASLYAFEKGTGSLKSGIKDRVNARIEELTKTPEVKQAEENVQTLAKVREAAEEKHKAAMAEHNKYQASHAQGIGSPEKIVNEVNKTKDALDEAEAHHELAKEDLAKKKAAQPTIPQRVGEAAGRAAGKVLPTPAPTPEVPAEAVEAKPVLSRLGQVKPEPTSPDTEWVEGKEGSWQNVLKEPPSLSKLGTKAPINVKTPGQVQPETFPQEPKPAPRVGYGKMNLAGDQGTVGKPLMLTEGTPEGPKVPAGGLPKIKLPETEAPKPQTGTAADLKALKVKEGKVIDTDESPEGRIGRLLQEALKTDTGTNKNFPAAKVEETPTEKRSAERRKEEKPVEEERRQSERRNAAGLRVDEHGDPVLPPNVEAAWQSSAFGEKPVEDVGAKARQANPEPTRAETKAAALPKEEQNGYAAKKEEVVPAGEDVKRPVKSAEEYHPAVEQKVNELSDENLKKLAQAHGLNPDEYDFKARDERRHRTERDQLAKDITEQIGEDEKINLGRAAESADKEPGFANRDQSAKGRADRAAKLFPRLRGPVDEFGNPKVSGGAPEATDLPDLPSLKGKGTIESNVHGDTAHLDWMYIKPEFRSKGLGSKAYVEWENSLPKEIKKVQLVAEGDRARNFWEKMGYKPEGESKPNAPATDMVKVVNHESTKPDLKQVISDYSKKEGFEPVKDNKVEVDPRSKEIARAYDDMKHDPSNPEVKKSYSALIDDAKKQWDALTKAGIKLEPQDEDPYKSYNEMKKDFDDNKRLKVWRGGNELPKDHPLAKVDPKTGETYNVMFRAVHDAIGHLLHDNDFSEKGESNAFDTHRQTMSKEAVPAMTTETKGQNSWVMNHGGSFEGMEQKAGILPERFVEDAPDPKAVLDHLKSGKDYALLTAENPNNERATPEQNAQKNREMKSELEKMGYKPTPVEGHVKDVEGQKENSFFVPDISPKDAAKISRKFGQASVMTKQGIHDLVKDTVHPSTGVLEGDEAAKQDYHSTVAGKPFSVSVDFNKEEDPQLPSVSGGAPATKLLTGDQLIKKYGESNGDPKDLTFILNDGRAVANTGVEHDRMLGGKPTDRVPPREKFIAEGNIRVRPHQGAGGREVSFSIPESGVTEKQLKYIQKMSPMLRSGGVMIEVGKPGGGYKAIPHGEASPEQIETAIRSIAPVLNEKGSPIDWNGNPTVSGGSSSKLASSLEKQLGKPVKVEEMNTNNNWGFGGWSGNRTFFKDGYFLDEGSASTRHAGEFPIKRVGHTDVSAALYDPKTFQKLWDKGEINTPEDFAHKYFSEKHPEMAEELKQRRAEASNKQAKFDAEEGPQSVGSARAGTSLAKEEPLTPKQLQERLPDLAQKHLTPEEKESLTTTATGKPRSAGTAKFVQNMTNIPSVQEYTDIAQQGEGARKWYSRSTAAFDAMHEEAPEYFKEGDKDKFMGVLAGSSPQQSVAMNLREALGFWKEWNDEGRPKFDLDKWKEFGDKAREDWEEDGSPRSRGLKTGASMHWDYAPTGPKWKAENLLLKNLTLPETKVPNIIKALNGEPMWPDLTKNQAFKAPSFAENLKKWIDGKSTGTKHVTNDSWMGLFGGIDKSALSKPENYHPLSVATRAAAEALGWEPEEAQAAIWSFTQALTEKGVEDPELVRHYSEDFKDLLANDLETRDILKGLGVNLDQLDRKLDAIGEKPKVSGRSTPTTAHSVGQLRGRIEDARGKGAIPEPRENPAFEHKAKPGEGHFTQPRDEATRFDPDEFKNEDAGLTKLGEKKKKSPYGNVR